MNKRSWFPVAAMVWLCCGLGNAEDPAARPASDVDELKGQIVAITLMSDSEDLVLLSEVSEKRLGGKTFFRGRGVDDKEVPDWRNGAFVYIPVDDVQQIVTFENLDAYRRNLEGRPNRAEGKAASSRKRSGPRT